MTRYIDSKDQRMQGKSSLSASPHSPPLSRPFFIHPLYPPLRKVLPGANHQPPQVCCGYMVLIL
jgi:hypothetical protein